MTQSPLKFTALVRVSENNEEKTYLAPYTDFPENLYSYYDKLENILEFIPIVFKMSENKMDSSLKVDVGIKLNKELTNVKPEALHQDVFIIGVFDHTEKECYEKEDVKIIESMTLWPSGKGFISFSKNKVKEKYSEECQNLYRKMFDVENNSLEEMLEQENDVYVLNEFLKTQKKDSKELTFDDLRKEHPEWDNTLNILETAISKKGVHITFVFGDMVGAFTHENAKNMVKFIKTCLSENKDWNINSPSGIVSIFRYETPFKMMDSEFNEKLVAGCVFNNNTIFRINENSMIMPNQIKEKEVRFVSIEKLMKHFNIDLKGNNK